MTVEKIENVDKRIAEKTAERKEISKQFHEIRQAIDESMQLYAVGDIDEKEMQQAKQLLNDKSAELKATDEVLDALEKVKKKIAAEMIPSVRKKRATQQQAAQKKVNAAVKEAQEARAAFLQALAKVGEERRQAGAADAEIRNLAQVAGLSETFETALNIPVTIPAGWTSESASIGVTEQTQKTAVKNGTVPTWAQ
ncbi:hypothetical protein [Jeotgalicoccus halotolerans]|uniref:Uncharacterized protein n=1 Tax=Jeotgalicoccus halotolerans TaxID=157227 RepID=A0A3E0AVL2_9STAP|nr:hypothetical protein [Jeotgalicoccus halotolerans]REG23794.1 hypothetical protein DFR63_1541 [Jeotgalicoccus halotolerans]